MEVVCFALSIFAKTFAKLLRTFLRKFLSFSRKANKFLLKFWRNCENENFISTLFQPPILRWCFSIFIGFVNSLLLFSKFILLLAFSHWCQRVWYFSLFHTCFLPLFLHSAHHFWYYSLFHTDFTCFLFVKQPGPNILPYFDSHCCSPLFLIH